MEKLARTNAARNQLQRLERMLRKFIDEQMTAAFGADWPNHRVMPKQVYSVAAAPLLGKGFKNSGDIDDASYTSRNGILI